MGIGAPAAALAATNGEKAMAALVARIVSRDEDHNIILPAMQLNTSLLLLLNYINVESATGVSTTKMNLICIYKCIVLVTYLVLFVATHGSVHLPTPFSMWNQDIAQDVEDKTMLANRSINTHRHRGG